MLVGYGHKGKISSMHDADSTKHKAKNGVATTQRIKPEVECNALA